MQRSASCTILLLASLFSLIIPLPSSATTTVRTSPSTNLRTPPPNEGEQHFDTAENAPSADHPLSTIDAAQLTNTLGHLPLSFVPNAGQVDRAVHFHTRGMGGNLFFTADEVVFTFAHPASRGAGGTSDQSGQRRESQNHTAAHMQRQERSPSAPPTVIRVQYQGANRAPAVSGTTRLPGVVNYFLGNDSSAWRTNLATYAGINYNALYPGIDLHYDGTAGQLKGTYTITPGSDPARIRWRYHGATSVQLDGSGNLVITLPPTPGANTTAGQAARTLVEHAPVAWQHINGQQTPVVVRYTLGTDRTVSFVVAAYDRTQPLIIDPTLTSSTYLGGSGDDEGAAIAVGSTGDVFLTGTTISPSFPTGQPGAGSTQTDRAAFVTRLDATGQTLLYSTYLGGNAADYSYAIAVDPANQAVVTGATRSADFPITQPFQAAKGAEQCSAPPCSDAFVARLNTSGSSLISSTYLGGSRDDSGLGITLDSAQNIYVVGETTSVNFPTASPLQPTKGTDSCALPPCTDGFVTKLTAQGNTLSYSTYLGGTNLDSASAIAIDGSGNALVTGSTASSNFPVTNALYDTARGGLDTFVTKLNTQGNALSYSTYLGGSDFDVGEGIAVDGGGNAYVTGATASSNFPVINAFQATLQGTIDAVVTKINAQGTSVQWSTHLGGSGSDIARAIVVDSAGAAIVVGSTDSPNFPVHQPIQGTLAGNDDLFVTKFQAPGNVLGYSTYLGGSQDDLGQGVALGQNGTAAVIGSSSSDSFPLASSQQSTRAGGSDVVIALINDPVSSGPPPSPTPTPAPGPEPTPLPPVDPLEPADPCAALSGPTTSGSPPATGFGTTATTIKNESFEISSQPLPPETYPLNCAFTRGPQAMPVAGLMNPDFSQGLTGWTSSQAHLVGAVDDDPHSPGGSHLLISGAEAWALSSAFLVPFEVQSLHFDYLAWSERSAINYSPVEIVAVRTSAPNTPLTIGTVYGSLNAGWLHAVVDLQQVRGETIQLRFRTHWDSGKARIDNLTLQTEVPDWTISNASAVQVVNDDPQSPGGQHLLIDDGEHWALSPAFTVPPEAQSLHFDYLVWGDWKAPETRSLEIVGFRATAPTNEVSVGTVYGMLQNGWQTAVLDLQAFRGETIRLRFRSDWYFGNARIDNLGLYVETPGWTPQQSQVVQVITDVPTTPVTVAEPANTSFDLSGVALPASSAPLNADFSVGQHITTWGGFTFTSSNVTGWTVSDPSHVYSVSDLSSINDGYLLLDAANQWAVSPVLTVPADTQSLHFDYMAWAGDGTNKQRTVEVEALSGPQFTTITPLGQVFGSKDKGWQHGADAGVLDLSSFQGQPMKLRFRSDWNDGRARIDSIALYSEVPSWTVSNAHAVRVVSEGVSPGGTHLRLSGGSQWAISAPVSVSEAAQSLHFDYMAWANGDQAQQQVVAVEVEVLSGPRFTTTTALGQVYGSYNLGWKGGLLDLQVFGGQTIKLRFRSDPSVSISNARIDNLQLHTDIPAWTVSNSQSVRQVQDAAPHTSAIHIMAAQQWAMSQPFVAPLDTERVRVEYRVWAVSPTDEARPLMIEVLSGDQFSTTTQIGTVFGTPTQLWQSVLLDITPFQGRTIRLRFRTGDDAQAQIDNVSLEHGAVGAPHGTDLAPDKSYLLLSLGQREVISAPFVVPASMTNLYFDYLNWTDANAIEQRGLEVEVVRAGVPPLLLGTMYGSSIQGWRQALLDVSSFHGQTIQLRFRTDWNGGKTKLDNVGDPNLIVSIYNQQAASVPTRPADAFYVRDNWDEELLIGGVKRTRAYQIGLAADVGTPYSQIILAFGRQQAETGQVYPGGPIIRTWGVNLAFEGGNHSNAWVRERAKEFITGYQAGHPGQLLGSVAIGTANGNYPWSCDNRSPETLSPDWRAAGLEWGKLIQSIGQPQGVLVRSANDIESWFNEPIFAENPNTADPDDAWIACGLGALKWYEGYRTSGVRTTNVFFGSNAWQEYAQTDAQNTINSNVGQWTIEQLRLVAYGLPEARAIPQIYCEGQAQSWVEVRRYRRIIFAGVLSENASDQRLACGGDTPVPGFTWNRSWTELDSQLRTAGPTGYPNHVSSAVTTFNYPDD